jgi:tetratricopeptide (TPR) repeat protein
MHPRFESAFAFDAGASTLETIPFIRDMPRTPPMARVPSASSPRGASSVHVALAVMLLAGLVHSSVLTAGFVSLQDAYYLRVAGGLHALSWSDVLGAFGVVCRPADTGAYYQPLTILSLALDARLTSDPSVTAFQFHLTNLALHVLNVAWAFLIVLTFCRSKLWALLAAAIFATHPVQVETVAWVSQRMTLLGAFFAFASLWSYLRHTASGHGYWVAPVMVFQVAALLCSPLFVGLPILFLLLDVWNGRSQSSGVILEKIPLFAVMLIWVVIQYSIAAPPRPGPETVPEGWELFAANLAGWIRRLFWPVDLAPFYPPSGAIGRAAPWLVSTWLVVLFVALPVWAHRHSRPLFLAIGGFAVLIAPALWDAPYAGGLLGDHYLYAALVAPLIALAGWASRRPRWWTLPSARIPALCGFALAAVLSVHAYTHTFNWQGSRELFQYVVGRYPASSRAYCGLVEAYIHEGEFDSALRTAQKAVAIDDANPETQFYLGTTLLLHPTALARDAVPPLRRALKSNPNWIACLQNLGVALARSGKTDEAIGYLEKARDLEPASPGIRIGLGHAYLKVRRPASARRELAEALKRRDDPTIHLGLAMAWAANDELDLARRHLAVAIAKDPRLAARAAASAELDAIRGEKWYESLVNPQTARPLTDDSVTSEWPAAISAGGS